MLMAIDHARTHDNDLRIDVARSPSQISFCRIAAMLIHSATACSQSLEDVVDAGEIPRSAKAKCWGSFTYNVCRGERGGIPKAEKSIDKLCECDGDKGGEVPRIKKKLRSCLIAHHFCHKSMKS